MKSKILFAVTLLLAAVLTFSACGLFAEKYTVTLDATGGRLDGDSSYEVKELSMLDLPSPKRDGYIFIGWYAGEGPTESKFTSTTQITSNLTLKAKWINEEDITNNGVKIDVHTVTYNANGGNLKGETSINAYTYSTINLPTPTMTGYVFLGWYVGEGANEALFTASSLVTRDIVLNAKWAKEEYTVSFTDYYGNVIKRDTVKYGESANPPTVPRISEKKLRFDAWDTDFSAVTADLTVNALYVLDAYSITYVTNSPQNIPEVSYFFDETPRVPSSPELGGHYFIGWYLDEEFTTEYFFDAPLTEDITLYAYFNESIPISTIEDFLAIPEYSSDNYFLKNDIDCQGAVITTSIIGFTGVINGEGHKIYNFVFSPSATATSGLFTTNGGTIKDITFDDFSYTLSNQNVNTSAGFLVGSNTGTIDNVHISNASLSFVHIATGGGDYRGTYSYTSTYGNFAGKNTGTVSGCSITASEFYIKNYTSTWYDSGHAVATLTGAVIVGQNDGATTDCHVDLSLTVVSENSGTAGYSNNSSYFNFGGIVAKNNGTLSCCDATLDMTASGNANRTLEFYFGGVAAKNYTTIDNCFATLKVTFNGGYSYCTAGGLVETNNGTINNSYTNVTVTSAISNAAIGGFAAFNYGGIYKCYSAGTMTVNAATYGKGGFTAYNDGSINSCFSGVSITATNGDKYGPFIGYVGTASYTTNCYYSNKATFTTNGEPQTFDATYADPANPLLDLSTEDFLVNTLGWSGDIWDFDENGFNYPTFK